MAKKANKSNVLTYPPKKAARAAEKAGRATRPACHSRMTRA